MNFNSGGGSIQSVTFDITPTGDYFDFDGSEFLNFTHPQPGYGPVLGGMGGLTPLDITVTTPQDGSYCDICLGHPLTLTFAFAPNTFIAGDWFRFSADVDPDTTWGGFFGARGSSFEVLMADGRSFSSPYLSYNDHQSVALIRVSEPTQPTQPTPTPIPTSLPLFASGLAGLGWLARRRKRSQARA